MRNNILRDVLTSHDLVDTYAAYLDRVSPMTDNTLPFAEGDTVQAHRQDHNAWSNATVLWLCGLSPTAYFVEFANGDRCAMLLDHLRECE
jgi:hypothetical protein